MRDLAASRTEEQKTRAKTLAENFLKGIRGEKKTTEVKDMVQELEKLGALKEKGLLTDEEFSAAKAKLLN